MIASRNSILRAAAGGSSRELSNLRALRSQLVKTGNRKGLRRFGKMVRQRVSGGKVATPHVHPRHKREVKNG